MIPGKINSLSAELGLLAGRVKLLSELCLSALDYDKWEAADDFKGYMADRLIGISGFLDDIQTDAETLSSYAERICIGTKEAV